MKKNYSQTARVQFAARLLPGRHQVLQAEQLDEGGAEGLPHEQVDR